MREINIKLYTFDELSEAAKNRAYLDYANTVSDFVWNEEYRATLAAFENAFDIKVTDYEVDENAFDYSFQHFREPPEGGWLRFAKWVSNNYGDVIATGKYYGKIVYQDGQPRHVKRYSKATVEYTCCFTGFMADMSITDPVWKCIHYKEKFETYENLVDACLTSFFETWRNDMEYEMSMEYFEELCSANEYEFTENGEMWRN